MCVYVYSLSLLFLIAVFFSFLFFFPLFPVCVVEVDASAFFRSFSLGEIVAFFFILFLWLK